MRPGCCESETALPHTLPAERDPGAAPREWRCIAPVYRAEETRLSEGERPTLARIRRSEFSPIDLPQ